MMDLIRVRYEEEVETTSLVRVKTGEEGRNDQPCKGEDRRRR